MLPMTPVYVYNLICRLYAEEAIRPEVADELYGQLVKGRIAEVIEYLKGKNLIQG